MKDYSVTVRVKNNWLLTAMVRKGIHTATELGKRAGVSNALIGDFLNLATTFKMVNGEWKEAVLKISDVLGVMPDHLVPPQHAEAKLRKNTVHFEASAEELVGLTDESTSHNPLALLEDKERSTIINEALMLRLTERERDVIELYFGLNGNREHTFLEIAEMFLVSPCRITQINQRALAKLRGEYNNNAPYITKMTTEDDLKRFHTRKIEAHDSLLKLKSYKDDMR